MSDSETPNQSGSNTKRYMSDDQGNPSSMRLMSMLALMIAGLLAIAPVFGWSGGKAEHVLYFLVAAFAPKAVQKFAEKK